jgi:hypothetical protein
VINALQAQTQRANPVTVQVSRSGDRVQISAATNVRDEYVVQLVRFTPEQTVDIRRGENAGRSYSYANIVKSWDVIGRWDGSGTLNMQADAFGDDGVAVIVQLSTSGPIVGAAQLR